MNPKKEIHHLRPSPPPFSSTSGIMTEPRRSTVYDYSDLRLHPDGSRVYQKDSNRQLWLANKVVQTANNSWIATDAGGSAKVPKFRGRGKKKATENEHEGEGFNYDDGGRPDDEDQNEEVSGDDEDESGQKRKLKKKVDGRTIKRRKFLQDYSFLGSGDEKKAVSAMPTLPMEQPSTLPHHEPFPFEPSADLLKFIHRFAAEYYTERGDLLNISREFRKQRKARRLERLAKAKRAREAKKRVSKQAKGKGKAFDNVSEEAGDLDPDLENEGEEETSSSSEGEGEGASKDGEANTDSESDYLSDDDTTKSNKGEGTSKEVKKGKTEVKKRLRWKGRKRAEMLYKDMYKMFDGSALLALGMLVQEQIAYLLMSQPPEGWEEEVKRTYDGREGSSDPNDGHEDRADGPLEKNHDDGREGSHEVQEAAENVIESNLGGAPEAASQAGQPDDARGNKDLSRQNKPSSPRDDSDSVSSPMSARIANDLDTSTKR